MPQYFALGSLAIITTLAGCSAPAGADTSGDTTQSPDGQAPLTGGGQTTDGATTGGPTPVEGQEGQPAATGGAPTTMPGASGGQSGGGEPNGGQPGEGTESSAGMKILCIGDSITYGTNGAGWVAAVDDGGAPWSWTGNTTYGPGYRAYLMDLLNDGGYSDWTFVGSQTGGGGGNESASMDILSGDLARHEGYPGNRTDHLQALLFGGMYFDAGGGNPTNVPGGSVPGQYAGHFANIDTPTVALVLLGTNDLIQGSYAYASGATTAEKITSHVNGNLKSIVDGLLAGAPGIEVFVATVPPLVSVFDSTNDSGGTPFSETQPAWNAAVKTLQASYAGNVHLVDLGAAVSQSNVAPPAADGVHPSTEGYIEIANAWYAGISSVFAAE